MCEITINCTSSGATGSTDTSAKLVKIATKSFSDFSSPSITNTIPSGYSLPAGYVIFSTIYKPTTFFTGTAMMTDYTICATLPSGQQITPVRSIYTGSTSYGPALGNDTASATTGATDTPISLTVQSVGDMLNTATAGVVDVYLLIAKLL